jgi:AcrR family transcriptional regulator
VSLSRQIVASAAVCIVMRVPRLWTDTIEAHRNAVRTAALDATAELAAEHGLRGVTMSRIAQRTGVGRATLYKYFADVEAILLAWHERQIDEHLDQLTQLRDANSTPDARLRAVLERYALLRQHQQPDADSDIDTHLHRSEHVGHSRDQLQRLLRDLIADAASAGDVRDDTSPDELANYCMHALDGATRLRSTAAVRRLVGLTLIALGTQRDVDSQPAASAPTAH